MPRAEKNTHISGSYAVGARLRAMREALDYDQAFIAKLCGMSAQAWNNNERGADRLGLNSALRIVQALAHHGIDLNWIYNGRMELMAPALREKILRLQVSAGAKKKVRSTSPKDRSPHP